MKKFAQFLMTVVILISVNQAFAMDGKDDKIVNKYKEIIANSAPDDWYTYANCAEKCIDKNINRKEVANWINKSLEIKETPYNLEVKGDYYIINNLPRKAGEMYLKAIRLGTELNSNFDATSLQEKLAKILQIDINS